MRMLGKDELSDEEKLENSLQDVLLDGNNNLKMECRNWLSYFNHFLQKH